MNERTTPRTSGPPPEGSPGGSAGGSAGGGHPPRVVDAAVAGVLLEAVALVAGAVWAVVELVTGRATATGAGLAVFALAVAAVLVGAGRALRRGSRRARGPVLTWQLLQAATALTLFGIDGAPVALPWGAAVALALAVGVAAAVLSPPALRHTLDGGGREG